MFLRLGKKHCPRMLAAITFDLGNICGSSTFCLHGVQVSAASAGIHTLTKSKTGEESGKHNPERDP